MSYLSAVLTSAYHQPPLAQRLSRLPRRDPGAIFIMLLTEAIVAGAAVIDDGGKNRPGGLIIAHWLSDWESLPVYPVPSYTLVQHLAASRGMPFGTPEQVWSDLEQAGLLTRAWNGHPISVRWRGDELEAFIMPLYALKVGSEQLFDPE